MRWSGVLIAIAVALLSFPGAGTAAAPPAEGRALLTLKASAPDGELTLAPPKAPPHALRLNVTAVENPSMQGVAIGIRLLLSAPGGSLEHTLGAVALFPPNRPGQFTVSIPDETARLIAGGAVPQRLLLHLQSPIVRQTLIEPLKVSLAQAHWR
jgi:hypothetical protein